MILVKLFILKINEAGALMSLQAAAAQQGLAPMTVAIESKIEDEIRRDQVAEILASGNPYGAPGCQPASQPTPTAAVFGSNRQ